LAGTGPRDGSLGPTAHPDGSLGPTDVVREALHAEAIPGRDGSLGPTARTHRTVRSDRLCVPVSGRFARTDWSRRRAAARTGVEAEAPETRLDGSLGPTDVRRETDDEDDIQTMIDDVLHVHSMHVFRTPWRCLGCCGEAWSLSTAA